MKNYAKPKLAEYTLLRFNIHQSEGMYFQSQKENVVTNSGLMYYTP